MKDFMVMQMPKMIMYQIKMNRKYLQGVEPNALYCRTGKATTMGRLHTASEYKSIWGDAPKCYEPLTATNYIKIIMEEFRWDGRKENKIQVIPILKQ